MTYQEVKDAIDEQIGGVKAEEAQELELDQLAIGNFDNKLKGLLEKYSNLEMLALNDCGLKSLDNFPNLPALQRLELNHNELKGSDLLKIKNLKNLACFSFSGNKLENYSDLEALKSLDQLVQVDFQDTKLSVHDDYREKVFSILQNVIYLDNKDKEGNIIEEGEDEELLEDDEDEDNLDDDDEEEFDEDDEEYDDEDEEEEKPSKKTKKN